MSKYRISVSIDEKNFFWIVVDNGRFIRNPTKEDLMGTKLKSYNKTNICSRCREENGITDNSILYPGKAYREKDKNRKETGRWTCSKCYFKNINIESDSYNNIIKQLRPCRMGSLDPNCPAAKGRKSQKLACRLYELKDLDIENDNYNSPLDCYDPKTGLYHQVQGRYYKYERWPFNGFKDEWGKIFENMICFCFSEDGNIVERIYIFPWKEIIEITGVTIYKNPSIRVPWYGQYRVTNEDELKKANEIWKEIIR